MERLLANVTDDKTVYLKATADGRLLVSIDEAAGGGSVSTSANQLIEIARLEAIRDRLPSAFLTPGLLSVDTLGTPGAPRIQATTNAVASIPLTSTCRRVSMYATQGTWYSLTGAATVASHYIAAGERLDFAVPANTTISVLREATDGSIRVTELI